VGICTYTLYPSSMIETLHTDRLLLQPLRLADAEQAQRLFPQWEIVRFMTTLIPWPYPADGTLRFYRDVALRVNFRQKYGRSRQRNGARSGKGCGIY
jgi:hypothetical protein